VGATARLVLGEGEARGRAGPCLATAAALAESDCSQYEPMATDYQRPGWFTKHVFNPIVAGLTRLGVSLVGSRVLEVRGRRSGDWRRTPVNPLKYEGERYIVAPRGETQWVRNLRASAKGPPAEGPQDRGVHRHRASRRREGGTSPRLPQEMGLGGRCVLSGRRGRCAGRRPAPDRATAPRLSDLAPPLAASMRVALPLRATRGSAGGSFR
jgi:hypothetical protein